VGVQAPDLDPCPYKELLNWEQTRFWLALQESSPTEGMQYALNVLWNENSLAVGVDQVFAQVRAHIYCSLPAPGRGGGLQSGSAYMHVIRMDGTGPRHSCCIEVAQDISFGSVAVGCSTHRDQLSVSVLWL